MNRFDDRVAIVTGAASGIGFAIASRLREEGVRLVLADLNEAALAAAAARFLLVDGPAVTLVAGDLGSRDVAETLVSQAVADHGHVDILVNCAGGGVILNTLDHTEETLRATVDRNLWTTIYSTLAVLPHMVDRKYGRIVNVGAESVRNGLFRHAVYNAAKGGVHAFGVGLAREFAESNITVNTIAPAWVMTPEAEAKLASSSSDVIAETNKFYSQILQTIPMNRPGTVEEVAAAVAFAASDESAYITGQVISVNGGSSMQ